MLEWVRSTNWQPACPGGGSQGFSVECPQTGECGHGKPTAQWQEVLAYRLAQAVGVAVPETVFGTFEGKTIAVSKSWGPVSVDVPKITPLAQADGSIDALRAGLRAASGILALHAWLGTQDFKDQHVVVRGAAPGVYEFAYIDFAQAAVWAGGDGGPVMVPGGPTALTENRDPATLAAAIGRIAGLAPEAIRTIVGEVPEEVLPMAEKERISNALSLRRGAIRGAFSSAGWIET